MQPSLLFDQGGGTIPYSEKLAPGQDVRITSVNAKWNGAAASGTFLACLSLYSQSGVLLSRSFPSQQFAAGDSGVVTYAPPLGASGAGAGVPFANAIAPTGKGFTGIGAQGANDVTLFSTSDSTVFDLSTATFGGSSFHGVRFLKAGTYLSLINYAIINATAGDVLRGGNQVTGLVTTDGPFINSNRTTSPSPGYATTAIVSLIQAHEVATPPSSAFIFLCENDTTANGTWSADSFFLYLGAGSLA